MTEAVWSGRFAVEEHREPAWQADCRDDDLVLETPVALVYNGISHAVMMASPVDLEDFGLGFSLTEGILEHPDELYDLTIHQEVDGIALHLEIASQRMAELRQHRRSLSGKTGCGLCGTESLEQAIRPIARVEARDPGDAVIQRVLSRLREHQPIQTATGASHGAAWCDLNGDILIAREDVGRHNALDKMIGALARQRTSRQEGFALVSSRASYEMVHKCASVGIGTLVAVSAATSLAVDQACRAGLMLVGFARPGRHLVYHRPSGTPSPALQHA
ncbi:formate dehydrogenase accessory sulfurtransferase FdhD [Halomonas sp. 18H]|uniref:formate dehydrogenase accessory sulfurtransferase FdhD n=1 Tax=Halomonas almeriensis TaxID=308163 RepID=UPI00222F5F3A|nr:MULTISPECIES: formate dehydrogenase accessory sulfurtransferase FdhD [Halomonas]MCW4151598.1 formate dehydrogenase accessory sulfurtransferase FdhD [Halomonas sp. 18H]MDN3552735.1 formate dehydrogenase accessory sulfurtransferase FdhD [Halomonas almeriensis]